MMINEAMRTCRPPKIKAAAYCRVSTDMETQTGSYELQFAYYTDLINADPRLELRRQGQKRIVRKETAGTDATHG